MATPRALSLSRTFLTKPTQTLTTALRTFTTAASPSPAALSRSGFSLHHHLRPLAAATAVLRRSSPAPSLRTFATGQVNSLRDSSTNYSNRPPKETILLVGCDFEHWLVVTEPPPENATRDEIIDSYIKTLAQIVGSEEEARMKIYSVSTRCYYAFGALVSEELSYKLKELPNVRWVLPDSYLDVRNKDYGGEPFINGQAVPYDPKYHEEWIRNNQKAMERNKRSGDRPRNADRSRNYDRRQRTSGNFQNNPNQGGNIDGPGGNMGGPGGNMGGPGGNMGGPGGNMGAMQNQPGGAPNVPPTNNPGYGQNMQQNNPNYGQHMPQNNPGYGSNMHQNNPGYRQNMPLNNQGYSQRGGPPPNYGGQGNPGHQNNIPNYRAGGGMPQNSYDPQGNMGGYGGSHQGQDGPGRDMPQY